MSKSAERQADVCDLYSWLCGDPFDNISPRTFMKYRQLAKRDIQGCAINPASRTAEDISVIVDAIAILVCIFSSHHTLTEHLTSPQPSSKSPKGILLLALLYVKRGNAAASN